MDDSILISIKKLLGLDSDYTFFDSDILMHINAVFAILTQLDIGPEEGFFITSDNEKWSDYTEEIKIINLIKPYIYMRVRLLFDPPSNSTTENSFNAKIEEYEWRMWKEKELISLNENNELETS